MRLRFYPAFVLYTFAFVCGALGAISAPTDMLTTIRAELLKQVDAKWNTSVTALSSPTEPQKSCSLHQKLSAISLTEVSVMRIPLSEALESLTANLSAQAAKELTLNFVVSGGVDPVVSLSLKNTTLADAIDLMIEASGFTYEVRGNTIVVLPAGSLGVLKTRYFPLSRSLVTRLIGAEAAKVIPPASSNNNTKTDDPAPLYQHNAAESSMKSFFERLGIVWPEGSGMVLADGELIVTHNTRTLDKIEDIINRLAKHRQVEIEARFLEVGEGALNELGVQWNLSNRSGNKTAGTTGVGTDTVANLRLLSSAFTNTSLTSSGANPPQVPTGLNLASGASASADLTGIIDGVSIRGILTALNQRDGTELLSAPRLTVISGTTASITVAQEMRYPQSYDRVNTDVGSGVSSGSVITAPTPLDFTTRNVGVQMQVTPYVEDDSSITLILQPEVTQFDRFVDYGGESVVINGGTTQKVPTGFFQPVFNVRKLTTEVNIPTGSTVLLGGLTRSEKITVSDKVPLLGDLPLIGRAFRSTGSSILKKNLIVFVTARLVE